MTTETLNIIIPAIMALILFGAFNGLIIRWKNEPFIDRQRMWSVWWHRCGLAIRAFIILLVWLYCHNYSVTGIILVTTSIEYNISINLINNLKWYYVGTTAKTDILIRKIFSFVNFGK